MAAERPARKLAVILHADVVGSTALVQLNETVAHERIQDTFRRFSETIGSYGGIAHEIRGDALVAEFARASDAVSASLAFQATNSTHNEKVADDIRPVVRVGIAMGEVVIADNTITGDGVVLAQRLEQLAESGGVCIQDAAYQTVPKRLAFEYENLGERELKGFEGPVRAYAVTLKSGAPSPSPEPRDATKKAKLTWRTMAGAVAAVLIVVGGALAWWQPWVSREGPASVERMALPSQDNPSIAVLPFANMSGDAEQEYFADGMTEDLITDLSKLSGLMVIARNSSFTYKDKSVDVKQIGSELGVKYVLEGSVRRANGKVRVNAQLIDASTGGHLWAERYDRDYTDIFALQDEVIGKIVTALEIKLTKSEQTELERTPTDNLGAYELYLQARKDSYSHRRVELAAGLSKYEEAIGLDPNFADAYAGYARTAAEILRLDQFKTLPADVARKRAYEYVTRALSLEPNLAAAHSTLGVLHLIDRNFDEAIGSSRRAVALEPSNADARINLALVLAFSGRPSEAVPVMEAASRLDPNPLTAFELFAGDILFMDGQYDRAIGRLLNAIEKVGGCPVCQGGAHLQLAMTYARLDRIAEAKEEVRALLPSRKWVNVEYYRQLYSYHKRESDLDQRLEALSKAGIPQWPTGYEVSGAERLSKLELQELALGRTWFGRSQNKYETFAQKTAEDGEVMYLQFGARWNGTVSIDNDRLCYRIPALLLGRKFCGYVYKNPQGTPENNNEYIAVDVFDVHHFSPRS